MCEPTSGVLGSIDEEPQGAESEECGKGALEQPNPSPGFETGDPSEMGQSESQGTGEGYPSRIRGISY